jgi:hypothetical protein
MKPIQSAESGQSRIPDPGFNAEVLMSAAKDAVQAALLRHKAQGNAVVVWRDGRVVLLQAEDIEV